MKNATTVRLVLAVGVIAEGLAAVAPGGYAYASPQDTYRVIEGSADMQDVFSSEVSVKEESVFRVDTADDLRRAFYEQSLELNNTFFLSINASLDLKQAIQQRDIGLIACQWSYQLPVDKDGKSVSTEYVLHMFTVEYRDDIKVLQAFRNSELADKLAANELALLKKAEQVVADIIKPGMDEYEKVLAVHDYLVLNGKYVSETDNPQIRASLHNAEGILMYGMGVCSSYASNMCLLLGMVDIECIFVTGIGQNKSGLSELHAWNKVKIDGAWYNIDTTWDDPTPDRAGVVSYAYFCLTDKALSVNHTWDNSLYPVADSGYHNYYNINDLLSRDYSQFKSIITREVNKQKNNSEVILAMYVENYDASTYDLGFIFDLLPNAQKVQHTKITGGSGEFTLNILQEGGRTAGAPNLATASEWARPIIGDAYNKNLIPSDVQGNYQNIITRAEFCRMAVKWIEYASGKSIDSVLAAKGLNRAPGVFSDTNDPDILAAYALGVISGTLAPTAENPGLFTPNGQLNREHAAVMIMNTCRLLGMTGDNIPDAGFADMDDASGWAHAGINFVRARGIMSGVGNNTFSPMAAYTREQSIATFNNIHLNP